MYRKISYRLICPIKGYWKKFPLLFSLCLFRNSFRYFKIPRLQLLKYLFPKYTNHSTAIVSSFTTPFGRNQQAAELY